MYDVKNGNASEGDLIASQNESLLLRELCKPRWAYFVYLSTIPDRNSRNSTTVENFLFSYIFKVCLIWKILNFNTETLNYLAGLLPRCNDQINNYFYEDIFVHCFYDEKALQWNEH